MSDPLSELSRPSRPLTWRERLAEWAEALDMTPVRLIGGVAALVVVGLVGWKLLSPPPPPPEMRLPFASSSVPVGQDARVAGERGPSTTVEPTEVVVHVAGAVALPGVQRLAAGTRVIDAVQAAGGAAADADLGRVNLAAPLSDGGQIYVPRLGEEMSPVAGSSGGPDAAGGPVDLNTAGVDELDALPGVGPAIAQAIVDHRAQHGRFSSVDQLLEVRGIGEAKLEQLRPLVTV